jgi:hypothetical protein
MFEVYSVPAHIFCQALKVWLGHDLDELTLKSLTFRLDEFMTGEISLVNLATLVGDGSLRRLIQTIEGARTWAMLLRPNSMLISL